MKTILILDDDPIIRKSLKGNLSNYGYSAVEAPSVPDAITAMRQKKIDLAIVDVKMPIAGGHDYCKHMRQRKRYSHIPIIILTGVGIPDGSDGAKKIGADAYFTKPYDLKELLVTIERLIGIGKTSVIDFP